MHEKEGGRVGTHFLYAEEKKQHEPFAHILHCGKSSMFETQNLLP